jgi:uncharacterized HAD superfamily protein
MAREPVAIDLDGVVVDLVSTMLPKLSELAGRAVTAEDITVYHPVAQALGLADDAMAELWDWLERERVYARAPPIDGAVSVLRALGCDPVSFVTSRPESLRGETVEWLTGHGLGHYRLEMGLPAQKLLEAGRFYALVEDNPTDLGSVASRVEVVLLYDQPWNRAAPPLANVVRVRGWAEIAELLNEGS